MNLRPLHDRILVRRLEEKETMRGGIIIPDSAKEKPQEAEVVAVGNGNCSKTASAPQSTSRLAIEFCSANIPAPISRLRARNI